MKTNYLIALCAMMFFAVSCGEGGNVEPTNEEQTEEIGSNNDEQAEDEQREKVKEPVIEGPVRRELDDIGVVLWQKDEFYEAFLPVRRMEAEIVGGSGDYKIIYPEKIRCYYWGDESTNKWVDYSEDILKIEVEGNIVRLELMIPSYNPDGSGGELDLETDFILEDSKGEQIPVHVQTMILLEGIY